MTLWRIKDGIPSLADALLVTGGVSTVIGIVVPSIDPMLNYFEPMGLVYLGWAGLFLLGAIVGVTGMIGFYRNEKIIRNEIRFSRWVFGYLSPVLIMVLTFSFGLLQPGMLMELIIIEATFILSLSVLYLVVANTAVGHPAAVNKTAAWIWMAWLALVLLAKLTGFLLKK
jgi:hypothetical protein